MEENVGITMTGDIVGTLRYMSPEQPADIYSLGISLYELLTTEPAFDGETRGTLLKQVAFEEPRHLRQIDRTISRDLETIIHKAIAKDPNERYSSAQQMADDLKAFRLHQPISARPPSIVDRSRKWVFRNQGLVIATALLEPRLGQILAKSHRLCAPCKLNNSFGGCFQHNRLYNSRNSDICNLKAIRLSAISASVLHLQSRFYISRS